MKKFRDMADSEKLEVINAMIAGDPVDYCEREGFKMNPVDKGLPFVCMDFYYQINARPMSIDWSVLKDEYICAATDIDGDAFSYHEKPELCRSGWDTGKPYFKLNGLKSYDPGTVDWQDSLIWRPGYGDNK